MECVPSQSMARDMQPQEGSVRCVVAIGTSTGGPQALQNILSGFPADFPASILVVQHMPPGFTKSLAQRLDSLCQIAVEEADHGMDLRHGQALIAKADWHLTIVRKGENLVTQLSQMPPEVGHRPSVNALFASLPAVRPAKLIAVVLTGMGNDGAARLTDIKDCGGTVLAEDASTAVIYGMPRAAAQTGCVDHVVPLHEMGAVITRLVLA